MTAVGDDPTSPANWRLALQVHAVAEVDDLGQITALRPPFHPDTDFALALIDPDGGEWPITADGHIDEDALPAGPDGGPGLALAENVWQIIRTADQSPVWAPVTD